MKKNSSNWKNNTFKYEPIDFTRRNIWMHQVEKQARKHATIEVLSVLISFLILAVFMAFAGILLSILS